MGERRGGERRTLMHLVIMGTAWGIKGSLLKMLPTCIDQLPTRMALTSSYGFGGGVRVCKHVFAHTFTQGFPSQETKGVPAAWAPIAMTLEKLSHPQQQDPGHPLGFPCQS